jgi:VWFA-related protein
MPSYKDTGVRDGIFTFNPRDTRPELEASLKIAIKFNVKFCTLDSRGLYSEASLPGSGFSLANSQSTSHSMDGMIRSTAHENTHALAELAHQTGGLFCENHNDLFKGIERAFADGREYYVLAYVPDDSALDGSYRKIEVTVKRKVQVNAKAG